MNDTPPIAEAAMCIVKYAERIGVKEICKLPGPWFHKIDDVWCIACNAHDKPEHCGPEGGMDIDLHPHHFAVWKNGWLFGLFTAWHGTFLGENGDGETEFIERMKRA